MATQLKLRVCTWNVGNAVPPSDLSVWLGTETDVHDIIVVAAQESNYLPELLLINPSPRASPASSEYTPTTAPPSSSSITPSTPATPFRRLSNAIRSSVRRRRTPSLTQPVFQSPGSDNIRVPLHLPPVPQTTTTEDHSQEYSLRNVDESLLIRSRGDACLHPPPLPLCFQHAAHSLPPLLHNPPDRHQFHDANEYDYDFDNHDESSHSFTSSLPPRPSRLELSSTPTSSRTDNSSTSPSGSAKFTKLVATNMPNDYDLVAKCAMMELVILVYIHKRHRERIDHHDVVAEATGLGNMVGNKGAVVAKVILDGTSFCFVNSHLAAHEGGKFLKQRHANVVEIMRNIEKYGRIGVPIIHWFDHVFWMGDLNYRLDVRRMVPESTTWPWKKRHAYVLRLIEEGRFADLATCDELRAELAEGNVFKGFAEGGLHFEPTFKVERGTGNATKYKTDRMPSFCDRILWHSKPMHKQHVKVCDYGCVSHIDSSDHKAVYGVFDVAIPEAVQWLPLPAAVHAKTCTIDFHELEVFGLYRNEGRSRGERRVDTERVFGYTVLDCGALELAEVGSGDEDEDILVEPRASKAWGRRGRGHRRCASESEAAGDGKDGTTRLPISVSFHANETVLDRRVQRVEVKRREGRRYCEYNELPTLMVRPVRGVEMLMHKYVTVVFERMGSKLGSGCVLPLALLVGKGKVDVVLELSKYGGEVGRVKLTAELVERQGEWCDATGAPVRVGPRPGMNGADEGEEGADDEDEEDGDDEDDDDGSDYCRHK